MNWSSSLRISVRVKAGSGLTVSNICVTAFDAEKFQLSIMFSSIFL